MDTCLPAPFDWPFPQPSHHNNYKPPPICTLWKSGIVPNMTSFFFFFFFAILSPTHHHTSLHVSPAQTISRDFPSNPSPALAGACVSQVLPWKPGWLGTQPELSGTLSWLPLFSSCTPANKEKKKRKNKSKQVFMWKKKVEVLLNVLMCARTNTLLMFPIRAGV